VDGAQAGETDEIDEVADDDVEGGWLPPPQAVRQRRSEDTTKPRTSGLFMDHLLKLRRAYSGSVSLKISL